MVVRIDNRLFERRERVPQARHSFHDSVAVELVEGTFTYYTNFSRALQSRCTGKLHLHGQGLSFEDTFQNTPPLPGTSIGQPLAKSSGTLGCYVKARRVAPDGSSAAEAKYLAATCHHVLHPGHVEAIAVTSSESIPVDHPSTVDSGHWETHLQGRVKHLEARLRDFDLDPHVYSPDLRAQYSQTLTDLRARLEAVRAAPGHFGHILCTSGLATYSTADGHLAHLDWGLVQIHDSRLPPGDQEGFINTPSIIEEAIALRDLESDAANDADPKVLVVKAGRGTGVTFGHLTGSEVLVREFVTQDDDQTQTQTMATEVLEHAIVHDGSTDRFAFYGDSGALVRDAHRNPVGFLFGGVTNKPKPGRAYLGVQTETETETKSCRPGDVVVYFSMPGADLSGACLYTPFGIVLESMRAALAAGSPGELELELVA